MPVPYVWDVAAENARERRRRRRRMVFAGIGAAAIVAAGGGLAVGFTHSDTVSGTGQAAAGTTVLPRWSYGGNGEGLGNGEGSGGNGSGSQGYGGGQGFGGGQRYGGGEGLGGSEGSGGQGFGGQGFGGGQGSGGEGLGGSESSSGVTHSATAAQSVGVVDINTVLGYQSAEAAGTGTIMTSDGEILTNNHVVDGATKITVTVVSTGKTYQASVIGTDPTQDVAVLQLSGASGLKTANYGSDDGLAVGRSVTGVGNAEGAGGTPSAATGKITALDQSITASDDGGGNAEKLSGLIETDAQIEPGDSGGPLYDSSGTIIGMDTAASTNGQVTVAGYAIPIEHALAIAHTIETAKVSTSTIHLGRPAFLGVEFTEQTAGAAVYEVLSGTPAARADITAGDVITAVGSRKVASPAALETALSNYQPGQSVTITWTDTAGASHHARVTLAAGPVD